MEQKIEHACTCARARAHTQAHTLTAATARKKENEASRIISLTLR